jgi:AmmeMemoRadiSam system protein A
MLTCTMAIAADKAKDSNMIKAEQVTDEEGRYLLSEARRVIEEKILNLEIPVESDLPDSGKLLERRGTFVTLTIEGGLRGCIGNIIPQESLIRGVKANALNAAFHDPRFRPLSRKEWSKVKIEVSILTEPKPLAYTDSKDLLEKLKPEQDGVIIKKGYHQATFLPQVWEQLPDKKEFLTHLCLKAGLDGDQWEKEKFEILTYQVQAFEE